jgi:cell division protein FtsL
MIRRCLFLYFVVFSIPLFLGIIAWRSARYAELEQETRRLEAVQENRVESNKRLIAGIAVLTSSERINHVAVHDLGLSRIRPEDILQILIEGRKGR